MTFCESVRGEWGKRCPDCGQMLPNPGPVRSSWVKRDDMHRVSVTGRTWTEVQKAAHAGRGTRT